MVTSLVLIVHWTNGSINQELPIGVKKLTEWSVITLSYSRLRHNYLMKDKIHRNLCVKPDICHALFSFEANRSTNIYICKSNSTLPDWSLNEQLISNIQFSVVSWGTGARDVDSISSERLTSWLTENGQLNYMELSAKFRSGWSLAFRTWHSMGTTISIRRLSVVTLGINYNLTVLTF